MKFCLPHQKKIGSYELDYGWYSLLQAYKKYVKPESTVLEIGSSVVVYTKELARECKKFIGVELFPERKPADFENAEFRLGDWQELSKVIEPSSIDIVVSNSVLEHVPDDLRAINELYKVLKPGGIALLNTPNRRRLTRVIIEILVGRRKFPWWEHQREYIEKDLIKLLEISDFKKYKIVPVVFGLHGGLFLHLYLESVPSLFRRYANYWQIHLFKEKEAIKY